MRIIADIGGTNVRFSLVNDKKEISNYERFEKIDFSDVTEALKYYISLLAVKPKDAVLAVNCAVIDGVPDSGTNLYWGYTSKTILQDTGLEKISYLNDLYAHAIAIDHIDNIEQYKVYGGKPNEKGTMFVVGPGTGLGGSYGNYNKESKKYDFYGTEVGWQITSSLTPKQQEVLDKILKIKPFSVWDELTSGRGITLIYEALYGIKKPTAEIMKELHEGNKKSQEVFGFFCEFLGILTRNIAVSFLPSKGIYIVGGILAREENLELFKKSSFYDFYSFTPNATPYIKDYPIYVITKEHLPFLGLANY